MHLCVLEVVASPVWCTLCGVIRVEHEELLSVCITDILVIGLLGKLEELLVTPNSSEGN